MNKNNYNGWENQKTWTVALHINNIEDIYFSIVYLLQNITYIPTYREVIYTLNLQHHQTYDGVYYLDNELNYEELNQVISEMGEE